MELISDGLSFSLSTKSLSWFWARESQFSLCVLICICQLGTQALCKSRVYETNEETQLCTSPVGALVSLHHSPAQPSGDRFLPCGCAVLMSLVGQRVRRASVSFQKQKPRVLKRIPVLLRALFAPQKVDSCSVTLGKAEADKSCPRRRGSWSLSKRRFSSLFSKPHKTFIITFLKTTN